jgi:hypothetical protein
MAAPMAARFHRRSLDINIMRNGSEAGWNPVNVPASCLIGNTNWLIFLRH